MKPIIEVNHLFKKYRYGESQPYYTLRDTIINVIRTPFKLSYKKQKLNILKKNEFWALRDISFRVNQGEAVGIIGSNGAGKSTLLRVLSRITPPTRGEAIIRGRVGSLLEVGTGFHPELTGRENIYLNGAILGIKRWEIKKKFDEIVNFAGTRSFLDTPVKRYSSGMYTRLAFSVAAHMESEILVIDEVLAVGDATFQKKCISKMEEVISSGRTILFVSHNMSFIGDLCKRSILLEKGKLKNVGSTNKIIARYLKNSKNDTMPLHKRIDRKGNGLIRFNGVKITNGSGDLVIKSFDKIKIELDLKGVLNFRNMEIKIAFLDQSSRVLFRIDSDTLSPNLIKNNRIMFETEPINLAPTTCIVNLGLLVDGILSDYIKNACSFDIVGTSKEKIKNYSGDMSTTLVKHTLIDGKND